MSTWIINKPRPITVAASQGLPITLVGIALPYIEHDNGVFSRQLATSRSTAKNLEGKKVAAPFRTFAHSKMLLEMDHLQVDSKKHID